MTTKHHHPAAFCSDAYSRLFDDLLRAVGERPPRNDIPLTGFWPTIGRNYSGELLLIGRAVNGWKNKWHHQETLKADRRRRIRADIAAGSDDPDQCPMLWVTAFAGRKKPHYNTRTSAFWRTAGQIVEGLHIADRSDPGWPSSIAWSNLMKVAPRHGGNPKGRLWSTQLPSAISLIRQEVKELRPRRILVLAGWSWFGPFAKELKLDVRRSRGLVEAVARSGRTTWVVAKHPQGKKEGRLVEQALRAFNEG